MQLEKFVGKRVHDYYWQQDLNCAMTTLKILSEKFEIPLNKQIIDAAIGMHGAGKDSILIILRIYVNNSQKALLFLRLNILQTLKEKMKNEK